MKKLLLLIIPLTFMLGGCDRDNQTITFKHPKNEAERDAVIANITSQLKLYNPTNPSSPEDWNNLVNNANALAVQSICSNVKWNCTLDINNRIVKVNNIESVQLTLKEVK